MSKTILGTECNCEAIVELTDADLHLVSGGFLGLTGTLNGGLRRAGQGGQNDPAQMFQQIMQQLTQGG
jgi:hypothetical protein